MLTTVPLFQHFDPTLHTAVHVNTSQHAVGDVLFHHVLRSEKYQQCGQYNQTK
jgi:hypothetical protein